MLGQFFRFVFDYSFLNWKGERLEREQYLYNLFRNNLCVFIVMMLSAYFWGLPKTSFNIAGFIFFLIGIYLCLAQFKLDLARSRDLGYGAWQSLLMFFSLCAIDAVLNKVFIDIDNFFSVASMAFLYLALASTSSSAGRFNLVVQPELSPLKKKLAVVGLIYIFIAFIPLLSPLGFIMEKLDKAHFGNHPFQQVVNKSALLPPPQHLLSVPQPVQPFNQPK